MDAPRLGYLLKRAHLGFGALVSEALDPLGIDNREWAVLISLDDRQPRSQAELATLIGIDRTTMVALLDSLQRKGLVDRRPHADDRRKNVIEITASGRDLRKRAARTVDAVERRFLAVLGEDEAARLRAALGAVIAPHEPPPDRPDPP
ncbi:MAG TPA: MarR family transcriptional regulator [Solirubrobacterales bacterium]|nr:MarR family transcriptional regulator [Solirubrobacterales bacterium]